LFPEECLSGKLNVKVADHIPLGLDRHEEEMEKLKNKAKKKTGRRAE